MGSLTYFSGDGDVYESPLHDNTLASGIFEVRKDRNAESKIDDTNPSLGSEAERSKSRARERSTNRSRERSRVRAKGRRQRSREPSRGPLKISQGTRAKCGHRRRSIFAAILEHRSGIRERQSGRSIMRRTGELTQIHAGGGILPALTRRGRQRPCCPRVVIRPCAGRLAGSVSLSQIAGEGFGPSAPQEKIGGAADASRSRNAGWAGESGWGRGFLVARRWRSPT